MNLLYRMWYRMIDKLALRRINKDTKKAVRAEVERHLLDQYDQGLIETVNTNRMGIPMLGGGIKVTRNHPTRRTEYDAKINARRIKLNNISNKSKKAIMNSMRGDKTGDIMKYVQKGSLAHTHKDASGNLIPGSDSVTKSIRSPFNYSNIDAFRKKEAYFARSLQRQIETILNSGYAFLSGNKEMLGIIHLELSKMTMRTGIGLDQFIARCVQNISAHGIVFVEKVRRGARRGFFKFKADNKDTEKEIVRFRFVNPNNLMVYIDDYGNIASMVERYTANTPLRAMRKSSGSRGSSKSAPPGIPASDITMGTIIHPGDDLFPDPPCFQMLDDILSLRSVEETMELLINQFSSPLLHATVGTVEEPAGRAQIADVYANIVAMAPNGFIVTPHTVEIKPINLQEAVFDLIPVIDHFKSRVLVGSGSSPISVGEAGNANRSSSESLDSALADHCMYMAKIISDMFNYNIIPDILRAAGKKDSEIFDMETGLPVVRMEFFEMQFERQLSRINNAINLWNANGITHDEFRSEVKRQPVNDSEQSKLVGKMFPEVTAEGAKKEVSKQNQPSNQHGGKSAPGSRKD